MAEPYHSFGSFILFKEVLADELGHQYRAGEFDLSGVKRTVWLRVFDGAGVPAAEIAAQAETTNRVGELLQAANVAANPRLVVEAGVPALAWNFVSGQPLSLVLRKAHEEGFPVPVDNALLILEKLSLGLSAALAVDVGGNPLVHGFLHPSLIVVSHDGEGLVAGFGAADQLLALLEAPGAPAIRPYLAPEVIITRTPSRRGDVYSLGAILFELLTSERLPDQPEARAAALERAQMAYDEQPVPPDIKALLQRVLAQRPEERFGSAADFKKELDKLLYGGAYSPTTFNLALFMDRLFRSEVEGEERERGVEATVSVEPYLKKPEPEPESAPAEREFEFAAPRVEARGKGLWIGIAVGVVVIALIVGFLLFRGGTTTIAQPTPAPQDVEAQKAAEAAKIKEAVGKELARLMAEKEKEIAAELSKRQGKIDELQKKLGSLQPGASGGAESAESKRSREDLERQIAAEKAAKQEQEKKLESERQRALEEAKRKAQAAAQGEPTLATTLATAPTPLGAAPTGRPTEPAPEPTLVAAALEPTAAPAPEVTRPTLPAVTTVTENMFLDPSQVDTLPATLKEAEVVWPRSALYSRRRGVVILQATVNSSGRVEEVKVLRADHDGFGIPEAAKEAVQKYLFKPATKNGINVKTHATVTIAYRFQTH